MAHSVTGPEVGGFIDAQSKGEAVARMYALAGASPESLGPGSTEKKSVLTAIARSLGLDVDLGAPKTRLAGQMAAALGEPWTDSGWSKGETVTLVGLNTVLRGAARAFDMRSVGQQLPSLLGSERFRYFHPARHKLEAVARIAALTHAEPQTLGPGSKERKSVMINLARDLGLSVDEQLAKPDLGAALAERLGVGWDATCWSTGSTVTLDGLNVLLAGAEERLRLLGATASEYWTPDREASAIVSALLPVLTDHWDGRECVREMREAEFSQWRQMEWPGFYFEMVGLKTLVDVLGGGPIRHANTRFDYGMDSAWDLKAHARALARGGSDVAILNDQSAFDACFQSGSGLGFVVLTGESTTSVEFGAWHRDFVGTQARKEGDHRLQRPRKESFSPYRLEAYFLRDADHLRASVAAGSVRHYSQGRQANGAPRKPKFSLDLVRGRQTGLLLEGKEVA